MVNLPSGVEAAENFLSAFFIKTYVYETVETHVEQRFFIKRHVFSLW